MLNRDKYKEYKKKVIRNFYLCRTVSMEKLSINSHTVPTPPLRLLLGIIRNFPPPQSQPSLELIAEQLSKHTLMVKKV